MATHETTVTTEDVRLSFVHLFKPYAIQQGQEPRYSTTILIPKTDNATMQRINAAIEAAIQQGVAGKWNGARPPKVKTPVWNGDGVRQNGEAFGPECKGCWVITAYSSQAPGIFDLSLNPIIDQSEVYSGMYARVNINFFPYANSGNRGIGCGLNLVQKRADGEPLGATRMSPEEAFGAPSAAPQQQYGQYAAPQQPGQVYNQAPYGQPTMQQQTGAIDPIAGMPIGRIDPITGQPKR